MTTPYQTQDAALMQALADLATTDLTTLFLPNNWQLLQTMTPSNSNGVQGYFAQGALPSTGAMVSVLALGMSWTNFMNWYLSVYHLLSPVPSSIIGGSTSDLANELEKSSYGLQESFIELARHRQFSAEEMRGSPDLVAEQLQSFRRAAAAIQSEVDGLTQTMRSMSAQKERAVQEVEGFGRSSGDLLGRVGQLTDALRTIKETLETLTAAVDTYDNFFAEYPSALASFNNRMGQQRGQFLTQTDSSVGAAPPPLFDLGYIQLYQKIQSAIWSNVTSLTNANLFVVGQCQSSPLAQLAMLDLRPGRSNPVSPLTTLTGYTFSTPPMGNQAFSTFFNANVTSYTVWANTVDFFPTAPAQSEGYYAAGQAQNLSAQVPQYDGPWYERSGVFYQSLLATTQTPLSVEGAQAAAGAGPQAKNVSTPEASATTSSSYDPDLAYTLSLLCAVAYQRFQHPNLPPPVPSTWTLFKDIQSGSTVFGSIFQSPTSVAVAFRGTVSWEELIDIQGNCFTGIAGYLPANSGKVSKGISALYQNLRSNLQTELQQIPGLANLQLIITGHSVGGALATLCALDLSVPQPGIQAPALVYTFGSPPVGDSTFASYYTQQLGSNSYRVARPSDIVPQLTLLGPGIYSQVGQTQSPSGFTNFDGQTFHPINSYITLLNPQGQT